MHQVRRILIADVSARACITFLMHATAFHIAIELVFSDATAQDLKTLHFSSVALKSINEEIAKWLEVLGSFDLILGTFCEFLNLNCVTG